MLIAIQVFVNIVQLWVNIVQRRVNIVQRRELVGWVIDDPPGAACGH